MSREEIDLRGGPSGVVLIHGLTGSPFELKYLATQLNRAGFTVKVPCLAGHHGDIAELKRSTWQDWYATVRTSIEELKASCRGVAVAGLCMGAVLAIHAAREYAPFVKAVACMSTTFKFDGWSLPWYSFLLPLNHYTPARYLYSYPESEPYGIKNERLRRSVVRGLKDNSLAYDCVPGVSMYQLNRLAGIVKAELARVTTPTLILHSREDDTASLDNANIIERRIGASDVRKIVLDDCYHMITIDNQRELVAQEVIAFFRKYATAGSQCDAG